MDVVVTVTEGPQLIVGDIRVVGYQRAAPENIIAEMSLRPGEPYGEAARLESQRQLYNMGLFRRVSIDQEPGSGRRTRPHHRVGGGTAGDQRRYWRRSRSPASDRDAHRWDGLGPPGLRAAGVLRNRPPEPRRKNRSIDFFSRGTLRRGQHEGDGYGFNEYRVAGTYFEPRAFHSDTNLSGGVSTERAVRSTFDFIQNSTNTDVVRRLSSRLRVSGRSSLEFTRLLNAQIPVDEQPIIDRFFPRVRLSMISTGTAWDSRNDPANPSHGSTLTADWQLAALAIGSEVGFTKIFLHGANFRPLSTARHIVFASRAEVGLARGFPQVVTDPLGGVNVVEDVPASQRFFAGGSTTVRGFQLDRLGTPEVLDENGLSKGGNGVVVLNAEVRAAMAKIGGRDLGVVGFTDAGNVFAKASQIDFTRLRVAYGFGVRYNSLLGPIRFDIGIKTSRQRFNGQLERGWEYHLNIGEAF